MYKFVQDHGLKDDSQLEMTHAPADYQKDSTLLSYTQAPCTMHFLVCLFS